MTITIDPSGVRDLDKYFESFPRTAPEAMSIAINDTTRGVAMKAVRREILSQTNFPAGYLDEPKRLYISRYSTPTRLEARITGRGRGTTLGRFAPLGTPVATKGSRARAGGGGITVRVNPGRSKFFAKGFLYQGNSGNILFGLRVRPGERVRGVDRYSPVVLFRDKKTGLPTAFSLYGPSVDQMLDSVGLQVAPEITAELESEFLRQFTRLSPGRNG